MIVPLEIHTIARSPIPVSFGEANCVTYFFEFTGRLASRFFQKVFTQLSESQIMEEA